MFRTKVLEKKLNICISFSKHFCRKSDSFGSNLTKVVESNNVITLDIGVSKIVKKDYYTKNEIGHSDFIF
jgi:hypothetical protein